MMAADAMDTLRRVEAMGLGAIDKLLVQTTLAVQERFREVRLNERFEDLALERVVELVAPWAVGKLAQ